jgi:hypothetical protein
MTVENPVVNSVEGRPLTGIKACACCGRRAEIDFFAFWLCLRCHPVGLDKVGLPPKCARWEPTAVPEQAAWAVTAKAWANKGPVV